MEKNVTSELAMKKLGASVGQLLRGGEVIELIGDVGAGKTTFVKGLAKGMGIDDTVQSPSFTITQVYETEDNLRLHHYDFYRLKSAGIMENELDESIHDTRSVTVIEWADSVKDVLPNNRLIISITAPTDTTRRLTFSGNTEMLGDL